MRARKQPARRRPAQRPRVLAAVLLLAAASAGAQTIGEVPLSVSASEGRPEIGLPDGAWRRAVIGRPVPAGSVATTWTTGTLVIEGDDVRIALAPFSHLEITDDGEPLALSLAAGEVEIAAAGEVSVALLSGEVGLRGRDVELRVDSRELEIISGEIEVRRSDGSTERLGRPGRYALGVHAPAPVFTAP